MTQYKKLILVAGKPGSGKTTAAQIASKALDNSYYFSIGSELRAIAFEGRQSAFGDEVCQYAEELRNHLPVPAHLAHLVLEECIIDSPAELIIVDGYPQYKDRLPEFNATLDRLAAKVLAICEIDVNDDVAHARLQKREDRVKDIEEDTEFIKRRLEGYTLNALPTIEQLAQSYPLRKIDGSAPKHEVADSLAKIIKEYL